MKRKRLSAFLSAMIISATMMPIDISASETKTELVMSDAVFINTSEDFTTPELFDTYLQEQLYGGISLLSVFDWESKLNDLEYYVYSQFKKEISDIANGTRKDSQVLISLTEEQQNQFTIINPANSGISWFENNANLDMTSDGKKAISDFVNSSINVSKILNCLKKSCACELYWFDKTQPTSSGYSYSRVYKGNGNQEMSIAGIQINFPVSVDFKVQNNQEYFVETPASKLTTVKNNVSKIIQKYDNLSDYDKLLKYKEEICNLVVYEDNHDNFSYGNVWQLLSVFDGDPTTNVVCEGYAKAFQYLCDLTEFHDDIYCYCVTGKMSSGDSGGSHMWNIVSMGNMKNYIVDVTNCDGNTVGAPEYLFMVGGEITGYLKYLDKLYPCYTVKAYDGIPVEYQYDSGSLSIYDVDELTLSDSKYPAHSDHEFIDQKCSTVCNICGAENVDANIHEKTSGTILAKSSTTHSWTCSSCGKSVSENHYFNISRVVSEAKISDANCTTPAKYYKSCECGAISTQNTDVFSYGKALGHNTVHVERKESTHTTDGNLEYWICDHESGVFYKNSSCTSKYDSKSETIIPAVAEHTYINLPYKCDRCDIIAPGFMLVDDYEDKEPYIYGHDFEGWYTDSSCTTPYTKSTGYAYAKFVKIKIEIKEQPKTLTLKSGETANFKVYAVGHELKYTWYYKLPSSKTYKKYADNMNNVLSMTASKSKNGTLLYCVISDSYGNTVKTDVTKMIVN